MKSSETIGELAKSLAVAQGQIEDAVKDTKNEFYKSKYADLSSVRAAIRKPFADNGLSVVQFPRTVSNGVEVETVLLHISGEFMSEVLFIPVKLEPHPIGSGISYARRYALMSIANLAADDDDGNAAQAAKAVEAPKQTAPRKPEMSKEEVTKLVTLAASAAEKGTLTLTEFWKSMTAEQRLIFTPDALKELKATAIAAGGGNE